MRELSGNCITKDCIFYEEPTACCMVRVVDERPCILNPSRFAEDMAKGNYSYAKAETGASYQIHIGVDDIIEPSKDVIINPEVEIEIVHPEVITVLAPDVVIQPEKVDIVVETIDDSKNEKKNFSEKNKKATIIE